MTVQFVNYDKYFNNKINIRLTKNEVFIGEIPSLCPIGNTAFIFTTTFYLKGDCVEYRAFNVTMITGNGREGIRFRPNQNRTFRVPNIPHIINFFDSLKNVKRAKDPFDRQ